MYVAYIIIPGYSKRIEARKPVLGEARKRNKKQRDRPADKQKEHDERRSDAPQEPVITITHGVSSRLQTSRRAGADHAANSIISPPREARGAVRAAAGLFIAPISR